MFLPEARLELAASSAQLWVGEVSTLLKQLPDYVEDDDATIAANVPNWESGFKPFGRLRSVVQLCCQL